jgi:hypothetical protein
MTDVATLQARLAEAETAYHKLMTGTRVIEIEHERIGRTRYDLGNAPGLLAYISDLRGRLAALGVGTGGRARARRAAF